MTYGNTLDKVGNKESERNLTDFLTNNYIGTPQPNKLCSLEDLAQRLQRRLRRRPFKGRSCGRVDEIPVRTQQFVAVTSSRIMPETEKTVIIKGGLISESFSRLLQSSKKMWQGQ